MTTDAASAARKLAPAVDLLADLGTVRSVEVQQKPDRVDVVIRVRLERKAARK